MKAESLALRDNLEMLFNKYLSAFITYDLNKTANCYFIPCTLSTPEKVLQIKDKQSFDNEFSAIFDQLKAMDTSEIKVLKASYEQLNEYMIIANVDWQFWANNKVYTDFTAFYTIAVEQNKLSIVNVISHELDSSLSLNHSFSIK